MVKRRTGLDPLAYMGVEPSTPAQFVEDNRNPTTNDYDNFNLMAVWLNRATYQVWMLVDKSDFIATWLPFSSSIGSLNTLTADTGTNPVPPTANNIDIFGGTGVNTVGTAGASLITINVDDSVATQYDADIGSAIPVANIINIVGGPHVQTTGAGNTITISPMGSVAVSIPTDAGVAAPAAGVLNVLGLAGRNISTSGAGNTVSIAVSGTTNNALQRGNATGSLTSLGLGTDGQVVIGATGGAPAFATMTSAGGTILFTPGANTLNLEAAGAGALTSVPCDVGAAAPAASVLNAFGGDNITTTGAGNTVTIAVSGTTQFAPQMGNAAGSLDDIGLMNDGELIIGATGASPQINTLTAGTGITITNAPGSITIDATGASTGGVIKTTFNASGMWTKNANTKMVRMVIYSGGASGASGARITNGTGSGGYVTGGGGGSVFGYTDYTIDADYLGATETVIVGASSLGGAAVLIDNTSGNSGVIANVSSFGTSNIVSGGRDASYLPGQGAIGGQTSGGPGIGGPPGIALLNYIGTAASPVAPPMQGGGSGSTTGGFSPTAIRIWGSPTAGGGGGSHRNGGSPTAGGDGGYIGSTPTGLYSYGVPGLGGAAGVSGTNGSDGVGSNSPWKVAGTGGGGGGGHPTNPGDGGDGGFPGGCGGGGGAVANGNPSGAGGDGAAGQVIIYEFLGM